MSNNIVIEPLSSKGQIVHIVHPDGNVRMGLPELLEYVEAERHVLDGLLQQSGAILLRGFPVNEKEDFLRVKEAFAGTAHFDYVDGNSPRTRLSTGIYTSTEYPKEFRIPLHSEMSYSSRWPDLLFFFCKTPAGEGGETPLVDCRLILEELGPGIVEDFERYGVRYTRYLSGSKGVGKSWMDTFETSDKDLVGQHCQDNGIEYSWDGNALFLSQTGAGVARHRVTGERVWFNQANQFHPAGLPEEIAKGLKLMHAKNKRKYPQYAYYGNGEEIPEQHIRDITEVHFDHAIKIPWKQGDIFILDNMLMAHGRMPFRGDRKILVSMCQTAVTSARVAG